MRRLWLILFVAMLPLQWSSAAVAALCLPDAGHDAPRAAAHRHAMAHGAAGLAPAAAGAHRHEAAAHAPDAAPPLHGPASRAHEPAGHAPDPAAVHAHDDDSAADCGGCCQAACQALPARAAHTQSLAAPQVRPQQAARPIAAPPLEGPFRPPRSLPA